MTRAHLNEESSTMDAGEARARMEAWNHRDFDRMRELMHLDYSSWGGSASDARAYVAAWKRGDYDKISELMGATPSLADGASAKGGAPASNPQRVNHAA